MTGRHAAAPDEQLDQRERDRMGSHRADVDPLGPDGAGVEAPVTKKAPVKKKASVVPKAPAKPTPQKKASTS